MSVKESIARFALACAVIGIVAVPLACLGLALWLYCQIPEWPSKEDLNGG
jgi:hypothetical protein